ncbi:MAG: prepilin-type N-terminal cleavage/methylation domain-containing protein [Candidatus Ratteibacteria bacterium]|nr:prepilin-type N-terminal cleavage/methylation domain-containing protein [Candidatus Ratteibacteria bacterium]
MNDKLSVISSRLMETDRGYKLSGKSEYQDGFTPFRDGNSKHNLTLDRAVRAKEKTKVFPGNYRNVKRHFLSLTGFTLLEVLISLAIVGLTLTVLIHSQLLSIKQATKAKYHTTIVFLANEILSDTFMRENPLTANEKENFQDYPEFSWEREVENSDIEGLKEIKITVSGPENSRIILHTYRLQSDTVQRGKKR